MRFVEKHCQKFNSLLLLFLTDLAELVPDSSIVSQARNFLNALVALSPGDTAVLEHFMTALQGCSDFINARNTDLFSKAPEVTSLVTKEDVVAIYRQLDEVDRSTTWRYLSKLYTLGKKACPELCSVEQAFDFNALTPQSPIHGLITTARAAMASNNNSPVAAAAGEGGGVLTAAAGGGGPSFDESQSSSLLSGGLIRTAYRQMAVGFLQAVHDDCLHDADVEKLCQDGIRTIGSLEATDPECSVLMNCVEMTYSNEAGGGLHSNDDGSGSSPLHGLVMSTEQTLRTHGFPLLPGGPELAQSLLDSARQPELIIAAAMQLGTLHLTLSTMDGDMIGKLEAMATKFCEQVQSGEVQLADNMSPFDMMQLLGSSGLSDDVMQLLGQ